MGKRRNREFKNDDTGGDVNDDDYEESENDMVENLNNLVTQNSPKATPYKSIQKNEKKIKHVKRRKNNQDKLAKQREDLHFVHRRNIGATSLESILRQALTTRDKKLLDSVFANEDLLVIRRTIIEVQPQLIDELLQQLISRMHATPLRMKELGPWLRELLRQHLSFCMSVPSIRQNIEKIQQHAAARLRYHNALIQLQGELDGIAALSFRRIEDAARAPVAQSPADQSALLRYREGVDSVYKTDALPTLAACLDGDDERESSVTGSSNSDSDRDVKKSRRIKFHKKSAGGNDENSVSDIYDSSDENSFDDFIMNDGNNEKAPASLGSEYEDESA